MSKILLRWDPPMPQHRRVTVFVGPDRDHLANCGTLTFRTEEAAAFRLTVRFGIMEPGCDGIFESGWEETNEEAS